MEGEGGHIQVFIRWSTYAHVLALICKQVSGMTLGSQGPWLPLRRTLGLCEGRRGPVYSTPKLMTIELFTTLVKINKLCSWWQTSLSAYDVRSCGLDGVGGEPSLQSGGVQHFVHVKSCWAVFTPHGVFPSGMEGVVRKTCFPQGRSKCRSYQTLGWHMAGAKDTRAWSSPTSLAQTEW